MIIKVSSAIKRTSVNITPEEKIISKKQRKEKIHHCVLIQKSLIH